MIRSRVLAIVIAAMGVVCPPLANAAILRSVVNGSIQSISGTQTPVALSVGDSITLEYTYNESGSYFTDYYNDVRPNPIVTVPLSIYPHLTAIRDTTATFSLNLIQLFSEFTGYSGYIASNNIAADNAIGRRIFQDSIFPSVKTSLEYDLNKPQGHVFGGGSISLWQQGQTGVTTVSYNFTVETVTVDSLNGRLGLATGLMMLFSRKFQKSRLSRYQIRPRSEHC